MATLTQRNTPRYEGRRVTREEYLNLPDDGFMYDMIEGVLHMSPSAFFEHNRSIFKFMSVIEKFCEKNKIFGEMAADTDVFFPDGGDVLRPDVCFILAENKRIIVGHIHGVPDLVCEVLSDSNRDRDLGVKADRYLANGVKEYWILDSANKSLAVWVNRGLAWQKHFGARLSSSLLSGLEISVDDIYGRA